MKRLILASLLTAVSFGALASSTYTCSGNGLTNTVEYSEYTSDLKINGLSLVPNGGGRVEPHGRFLQVLKDEYPSLEGQHQYEVLYTKDWRHPTAVIDLDNIDAQDGFYTAEQQNAAVTECAQNMPRVPSAAERKAAKDAAARQAAAKQDEAKKLQEYYEQIAKEEAKEKAAADAAAKVPQW